MPKLLRILATATVALAAVAGTGLTASAQEGPGPAVETHYGPASWDACPAGRVCLFSAAAGHGAVWFALRCGYHNLHDYGVGDWAASYWSRTGQRIQMYDWGSATREEYGGGQGNFVIGKAYVYDEMTVVC